MTRREQLQENVEDAVFALLMEDVAEQEGKRLIEISDVSTSLRLVGVHNGSTAQDAGTDGTDSVQTLWGYRLPEIPNGYEVVFEDSSDRATTLWCSGTDGSSIKFNIF